MNRKQHLYLWLAGFFVSALITGDLIGAKFFRLGGVDLSVGMIPFPLTFVLTDIVNEFYGKEGARRITFVGLAMAVFVFVVINVAIHLPVSVESPMPQEVFARAFGWSSRLYVASLTAYLVGQLIDIWAFQLLRQVSGDRWLWLRATGSTLLSQAVDTLVVNFVLLADVKPLSFVLTVAQNSYITKLAIAVSATPLIYLGRRLVLRYLAGPRNQSEAVGELAAGAQGEPPASEAQG